MCVLETHTKISSWTTDVIDCPYSYLDTRTCVDLYLCAWMEGMEPERKSCTLQTESRCSQIKQIACNVPYRLGKEAGLCQRWKKTGREKLATGTLVTTTRLPSLRHLANHWISVPLSPFLCHLPSCFRWSNERCEHSCKTSIVSLHICIYMYLYLYIIPLIGMKTICISVWLFLYWLFK